ncbi:hypothetical protein KEM54_005889 [Ascosphaera aggregata]|nr:hypothetical protein KEM54_005889 [Ascosphaera aggregata]
MQLNKHSSTFSLVYFASLAAGISWDCSDIRVDGKKWDLSALGGVHSVYSVIEHPPVIKNTTFILDICRPLKKSDCQPGTNVCGVETTIYKDGHKDVTGTIPIAGNYVSDSGNTLDPKVTRLKSMNAEREGLDIELHGGQYPFESKDGRRQKAVIQMICDSTRSGLEESVEESSGELVSGNNRPVSRNDTINVREDKSGDDNGDKGAPKKVPSLQFISYGPVDEMDVLRLDWISKYACEDYKDKTDAGSKSSSWGFFTWFIIMYEPSPPPSPSPHVFLGISAYLIFGSWLNYNRYGARGWDLLPHGDTLRDIPYIVKDWGRAIVNTVQDSGSRGGYSAV